jgi:hypothetical protein
MFVADGGLAMWNNGLVRPGVPGGVGVLVALGLVGAWMFATLASLYGFVAQFLFRYLTLNRSVTVRAHILHYCLKYLLLGTKGSLLKKKNI